VESITQPVDAGESHWGGVVPASETLAGMVASGGVVDVALLGPLLDHLPAICWLARGDGYALWVNRRWQEYCGLTQEALIGMGYMAVVDPDTVESFSSDWLERVAAGQPFEAHISLLGADAVSRPFIGRAQPVVDAAGEIVAWFGLNLDVSKQVAAESALLAAEAKSHSILERIGEGVFIIGRDFHLLDVNAECARLDGRPSEAIVGRHILEVWPHIAGTALWETYQRSMATGESATIELSLIYQEKLAWRDARIYPVDEGVAVFYRDITDRKLAAAALVESESRFEAIVESIDPMIWTTDANGLAVFRNQRWFEWTGFPQDHVSTDVRPAIIHPDDQARESEIWDRALKTGEPYECDFRMHHHSGEYRWVTSRAKAMRDEAGRIQEWYGVCLDIHDQVLVQTGLRDLNETLERRVAEEMARRADAEDALRQAQKMEAVGQLTGGLAHDFNNLLTAIAGALELISDRVAQGRFDALARLIGVADGATRRAAALTQRLLAFSRRQTLDPKATDLNALVLGMADLIGRTVGPTIDLKLELAPDLWRVMIDPNQLESALLNLCINARDAMPEGGELKIKTSRHDLDAAEAEAQNLQPGSYVWLCVIDTGTGMPPEVIERAFDPFFTTKPLGGGTGLGLSMVYGFARQSGGHARIISEVGRGTTLCVYLPRDLTASEETAPTDDIEAANRVALGGTILVVDDEAAVRALIAESLQEAGYEVLEAEDGEAGLRILRSPAVISLLVTDVGLPGGMNGRQMADAARTSRPDLKVLFITGYAEGQVMAKAATEPGLRILSKPFPLQVLVSKVAEILAET